MHKLEAYRNETSNIKNDQTATLHSHRFMAIISKYMASYPIPS